MRALLDAMALLGAFDIAVWIYTILTKPRHL